MTTRRALLKQGLGASGALALGLSGSRWASAQVTSTEQERNKAAVRAFKETQGTPEHADVLKEVMSPNYNRLRGGFYNLARNAADQGFPSPGSYLRTAFPDRQDAIEEVIADGDMVGMLFRITGTHLGNFFGIPPTGKTIDLYEVGLFKLVDGKITEAFFMADEAALLKQLGARLPERKDGRLIPPPISDDGEFGDEVLERLRAISSASAEVRNKITVVRTKAPSPPDNLRASNYVRLRGGFEHLNQHGRANNMSDQGIGQAFPDRRDKVDHVLAEGSRVWMLFRLNGTNTRSLFGMPPSNNPVQVPELGRMTFVDGQWQTGWYFGDELGMLLQIGTPNALFG
jgi:predicted ester cyclase